MAIDKDMIMAFDKDKLEAAMHTAVNGLAHEIAPKLSDVTGWSDAPLMAPGEFSGRKMSIGGGSIVLDEKIIAEVTDTEFVLPHDVAEKLRAKLDEQMPDLLKGCFTMACTITPDTKDNPPFSFGIEGVCRRLKMDLDELFAHKVVP